MKFLGCFVVLFLITLGTADFALGSAPVNHQTIEQIINSHGFEVELHNITTEDGYYLALYRIVHPQESIGLPQETGYYSYTVERKPVIVQHGLFGSAADFLINSPHLYSNTSNCSDNLAFGLHLTDRYDVWLSNSRGNRYSRGHTVLKHYQQQKYWKFSFDHKAQYDMPAIVDYVRNVTEKNTVGFVGYSQGTSMMFALLSLKPEYAQVVKPFIALAPVTTIAQIESPINRLASWGRGLRLLGGEFLPSSYIVNKLLSGLSKLFCLDDRDVYCQNMVFLFSGYEPKHLNLTRIPVYSQFLPSSTSSWEIAHWAQLVQSKGFTRFDYGTARGNREAYGQVTAPEFPLDHIEPNAVISLFRARNDYLSSMGDTSRLIEWLRKNGVRVNDHIVTDPNWTHIDFVLGNDAGKLVYDRVIEELDKYTQ